MTRRNAPLNLEGRRRLVQRCQFRPIAHVAAEMGISRACASRWVNRWRRYGDLGLHDRSSAPRHSPSATPAHVIARIEVWRREHKWSAARITHELAANGVRLNRRTVTRHLARLGLGQRKFIDPTGELNRCQLSRKSVSVSANVFHAVSLSLILSQAALIKRTDSDGVRCQARPGLKGSSPCSASCEERPRGGERRRRPLSGNPRRRR